MKTIMFTVFFAFSAGVYAQSSQTPEGLPAVIAQNVQPSTLSPSERDKRLKAGTHDWYGNPRDFQGAIWIRPATAIFGADNPNGKQLDLMIKDLAKFSLARRQAIAEAKNAELRQDPSAMNRFSEVIARNGALAEAKAAEFMRLWNQQPLEYRMKFGNPPKRSGTIPHISEGPRTEIQAYVDDKNGKIYKIVTTDGFRAFCTKGGLGC